MTRFSDDEFRTALRAHMERDGVKIMPLAQATKVSRSVISKFLSGARPSIRFEHAVALIDYWGETVAEFLNVDVPLEQRQKAKEIIDDLSPDDLEVLLRQLAGLRAPKHPRS